MKRNGRIGTDESFAHIGNLTDTDNTIVNIDEPFMRIRKHGKQEEARGKRNMNEV